MNKDYEGPFRRDIFKRLIKEQHTTQARLAKQVGYSRPYLSQIASGAIPKPSLDLVIKLSGVLGCTFEELAGIPSNPIPLHPLVSRLNDFISNPLIPNNDRQFVMAMVVDHINHFEKEIQTRIP